jgi:subtilisin-like proprotein convertase family protein
MKKLLLFLALSLSITWTFAQTTISTTDTLHLVDTNGVLQTSKGFVDKEVIGNVSKIDSLITSFEHTYIGDIIVWIECPNGTKVQIFDGNDADDDLDRDGNKNNVGYYLGIPYSDVDGVEGAGEGWTYSFKTGPSQLLTDGPHHEVTTGDGKDTQESIEGGTYKFKGDISDLVGCPLNGNWAIKVMDDQSADDGYLFGWSLVLVDDTTYVEQPNPYDTANQKETLTANSTIDDFTAIDSVKIVSYSYVSEDTTNVTWRIYDDTNVDLSLDVATPVADVYELTLILTPETRAEKKSVLKVTDYIDTRVVTNVEKLEKNNEISIYPNPTKGMVRIQATANATVEIINIAGKTIKTINTTTQNTEINLNQEPRGIYFVKVTTAKGVFTKKLILE